MTDSSGPRTWSLRARLAASLILVAAIAIIGVTLAALLGTQRGFVSVDNSDRQLVAEQIAADLSVAVQEAGSWNAVDLSAAEQRAESEGARLIVRPGNAGRGQANDNLPGGDQTPRMVSADVVVDGVVAGSIRLTFRQSATGLGRTIAWTWIATAAAVALAAAALLAWWLSRRLTQPIDRLGRTVLAFGAGDREARAPRDGPGEIGELARAFDDMADRIQLGEQTRRALAHDVAHELRTPLAALQAGLEELRDGLEPADPERLAALHDQSLRIGRIVSDLGVLAEAEAPDHQLTRRRVDLATLARSGVEAAHGLLASAEVRATCECAETVPVWADADRVGQILSNLLANSARYCRPGDAVTVSAYVEGATGVLRVADTGPGMQQQDVEQAFDRFHRGRHATDPSGSGLGLAIVRALAQAQGGSASLASTPGEGTVVSVRLPLWTDQHSEEL